MSEADLPRPDLKREPGAAQIQARVAELEQRIAELEGADAPAGSRAETRLRAFLRHTPEAIFIKDSDGRYTDISDSFLKLAGRTREDIIGRTDYDPRPVGGAVGRSDDRLRARRRRLHDQGACRATARVSP
jgi:PAS domain-containing protein